jgi:hypothetical protein
MLCLKRKEMNETILRKAHNHSSNHRREILISELCGCFYCKATFAPSEIEEWVDEDKSNIGQTALCPKCGIDSVIGSKSEFPINDKRFLKEMHKYWFDRTVSLK